jgi:hypothetical protein
MAENKGNILDIKMDNVRGVLFRAWLKLYKPLLTVCLISSIGFGAYYWYLNLYRSQWTEEQKKQYLLEKKQDKNLKREVFEKTLRELEENQKRFETEIEVGRNVFKPY